MLLAGASGNVSIEQIAKADSQTQWVSNPITTFTGRSVSSSDALGIPAFYSGANLIAKTIGMMPLRTINEASGHRDVVTGAGVARRIKVQPAPGMTGVTFWTTVAAHIVIAGNSYAMKLPATDGLDAPELYLVTPGSVSPYRAKGQVRYRVQLAQGESADLPAAAVVHFKGVSYGTGLLGHSPVSVLRHRLAVSLSSSEYQQRFFKQGATPKGVLSVEGTLEGDQATTIRDQWHAAYGGVENAHSIAVLDHGAKFQGVSMSNDDAQFIEQMRYGAREIAAMLNLPPEYVGAEGSSLKYSTQQSNDLHLVKFACQPITKSIEATLNADPEFFGEATPWVPEFDPDPIVRPDIETRFRVYEVGRRAGIYTANEARAMEGLKPFEAEEKSADQTIEYRLKAAVEGGVMTVNEARQALGLDPVEGGDELKTTEPEGGTE
jgi:HK97 family phage portal protein